MAMAHYLVGLPLAALFAFGFHAGLFGLWLGKAASTPEPPMYAYSAAQSDSVFASCVTGFGVGLFLVCARLVYLVVYNDWQASARKAQAHLRASDGTSIPTHMTNIV